MHSLKALVHAASSVVRQLPAPPSFCISKPSPNILSFVEFDISPTTGFIPSTIPLRRLPPAYEPWECALDLVNCGGDSVLALGEDSSPDALAKRESGEQWRQNIRDMPILSTEPMNGCIRQQRRAHLVLAYLVHFYVHSLTPSTSVAPVIPASLAIPLVTISDALGIAPILTYADTVLWNVTPRNIAQPLAPGNIRILTNFSGTDDEEAFYEVCAQIELFGAEALHIMATYQNLNIKDTYRLRLDTLCSVATCLDQITTHIEDLTTILKGVHNWCAPKTFYDNIRPWFRGSSSGSIPWVYEGVTAAHGWKEEWRTLSGPSGGQSTLMHALDAFLDVDHSMEKTDDLRTFITPRKGNDRSFMRRMQQYMPAVQRAFLDHIGSSSFPIRQFATSVSNSISPNAKEVVNKYNSAVMALRKFRDAHLKIACVYIVVQARKAEAAEATSMSPEPALAPCLPPAPSGCPVSAMLLRLVAEGDPDLLAVCPISGMNIKDVPSTPAAMPPNSIHQQSTKSASVIGTGGTEVVSLLRSCRDSTSRAIVPTPC